MQTIKYAMMAVIGSLLLVSASPVFANSNQQVIESKIHAIRKELRREQSARSVMSGALKQSELALAAVSKKLAETSAQSQQAQLTLKHLKQQHQQMEQQLANELNHIRTQLRYLYVLSRQPYLKLLLNQNDVRQFERLMVYYRFISHNRVILIAKLKKTLKALSNNQKKLQQQTKTLAALQAKLQQQRHGLSQLENERLKVIHAMDTKIHSKQHRLALLMTNQHHLEHTISRLKRSQLIAAIARQNLADLKGHLSWPTKGKIMHNFGTQIDQSELRWEGVLILAREDQPVHAITKGKVVFADWMPGYGLLIIVSHGHGYMSLYGRNHTLNKKVGDVVQKGDIIATVGNSGGYKRPALYFAIRHNAKPVNPYSWCSSNA